MGKSTKAFKKFASSGKLKDTIQKRRQHQQAKRKSDDRKTQRSKQRGAAHDSDDDIEDEGSEGEDEEDEREAKRIGKPNAGGKAGGVAKTVEELFGAGGLDVEGGEESELEELGSEDEDEVDDEEDDGEEDPLDEEAMKKAMKDLAKNDPEFFKYLKENDEDLLDFGQSSKASKGKGKQDEDEEDDEDEEMESDEEGLGEDEEEDEAERKRITVTLKMLRQWQEGMLRQHSIRSLRKTLIAFRAAAHMNEEDGDQGSGLDTKYIIDSAQVFNKIVVTALKFTPVVIAHHFPYKTLPQGKVKLQPPKKTNQTLNRLILSHFSTLLHLIKSLPTAPSSVAPKKDEGASGLLLTAVGESTKLIPWVLSARKHLRAYLKVLLDLWSSAGDDVRIASFLAVRKLFVAGDDAVKDLCLRNIYRSLLPPLRNTTPHTLPSLNLMKNTASELYQLAPSLSYQHAFGFIRMLAVHLRNVVRSSTTGKAGDNQQAFKAVYNWQYVHCIDFWSQVLAGAASVENQKANAGLESPLKPLVYPLVQIALGAVRLLPSSRYFPLRFHILHSLLRIVSRTGTYIPLAPFLLEILDSTEFRRANPKKGTIKPLDFEYIIRAPAAYPKTRVFQEGLGEELVFLLGEYHAAVSTQIAFPEMVLPVILTIKKHIKKGSAGSAKVVSSLKVLVEKLEATRTFIENKRRNVSFAPRDRAEVDRFLEGQGPEVTPVGNWMRLQRKIREQKRSEVEKALREEQDEDEDSE
ncbi:nucleolar complex protein 2 [Cryptococcus gattii Ru294]|nr:nucleolar complex protein 2 [Cryptococcus gattii Ru294]